MADTLNPGAETRRLQTIAEREDADLLKWILERACAPEPDVTTRAGLALSPPSINLRTPPFAELNERPPREQAAYAGSARPRTTGYIEVKSNLDIAPCLSAIMPVFNEETTVAQVIATVLAQRPVQEVVVVDDASQDKTWEVLQNLGRREPRLKLFRHERNQGKGAALRTGFRHASAPIVIVQDADMEYDPSEYYLLLGPILSDRADVVFGSRFQGAGAHRVLYFWHSVGNKFLTMISNMATNLNLTDMETGYKVFRREVLQRITLEEGRFGFEPEVIAKISKLNLRIYEVPISYFGRTYEEGKKISWKDGFSALRCVIKYNWLR
jgi:glycosyltransferase involved in cell wall biosynthesis